MPTVPTVEAVTQPAPPPVASGPLFWAPGVALPGELRLLEPIGAGGMAEVWKAWSLRLHRPAAVKRLLAPSGRQETERVLGEARAAARLRHPSIVEIHDCLVDEEGRPFLVMEWIDGIDLHRVVQRAGRLPATTAVRMLLPVAAGLAHAHRRGVVHGDVKPENVLFARQHGGAGRRIKLIDFGIAGIDGSTVGPRMALTPDYAAPERVALGQRGPAADQWAFCVMLYELVTGRLPFEGSSFESLFAKIASAPLPYPRDVDLDGALFRILARGTRKRPEDRYPDMVALRLDLEAWAVAQGLTNDALGRPLRAPRPLERRR